MQVHNALHTCRLGIQSLLSEVQTSRTWSDSHMPSGLNSCLYL
jgi:hypothetical protein